MEVAVLVVWLIVVITGTANVLVVVEIVNPVLKNVMTLVSSLVIVVAIVV